MQTFFPHFCNVLTSGGACEDVRQTFHNVTEMNRMERNEKLVEMLQEQMKVKGKDKTLIFVEQKKHADVLALFLCQEELPTTTIHGNNSLLTFVSI